MCIEEHAEWPVSAELTGGTRADWYLKYGNTLIGAGDTGSENSGRSDLEVNSRLVRHFVGALLARDLLQRRIGISTARRLGLIASVCRHLPQVDSLNGWILQRRWHARRFEIRAPNELNGGVAGANLRRLLGVRAESFVRYRNQSDLSPRTHWQAHGLPRSPPTATPRTSPYELQERGPRIRDLSASHWYLDAAGERPAEDDSATDDVARFRCALKWPVERIAVRLRQIDLGVFSKLPITLENSQHLILANRVGTGVEAARDQQIRFAPGVAVRCAVKSSDGVCYRMQGASKELAPIAYANLQAPEAVVPKTHQPHE